MNANTNQHRDPSFLCACRLFAKCLLYCLLNLPIYLVISFLVLVALLIMMVFFLIICIPIAVCFPHCLVEIPLEQMLDIKIVQDLDVSSTKRNCTASNDDDADESIVISDTNRQYDIEDGGSTAIQQQQQHKSPESPMDISVSNSSCHDKNEDDIESHQPSIILLDMKSNPSCDICLMNYKIGDEVTISHNPDCSHIFHKECILEWLRKRQTCPCCRRNYLLSFQNERV